MNDLERPYRFETNSSGAGRPWREPPAEPPPTRWSVHLGLFFATLITTSLAGAYNAGVDPFAHWSNILSGLPFSLTLLTILLIHEMGHYTVARFHHVHATLPYFIPAPPFFVIGTFGAFIRMQTPPPNRKALFDVGAAGPWAGLIAAIPAVLVGLHWSKIQPTGLIEGGLTLGEPLLFSFLSWIALGDVGEHMTIVLHPVALAGWFGFLVTFLNLLPIGQLDGGHVAYAFFGRWHRWIARAFLGLIVVLGFQGWPGWFVWVALLALIGLDHPPTLDAWIGLDRPRKLAVAMTGVIFALTFMAEPVSFTLPEPQFEGERVPVSWQMIQDAATSAGAESGRTRYVASW